MKVGVLATTLAILMVGGFSLSAQAGPAGDGDSDGTFDVLDICSADPSAPSPIGCDTDGDGYGNACDGDFNNDGSVALGDFGTFGGTFGDTGAPGSLVTDLNCDGSVALGDFGIFGTQFGLGAPGPSGLSCAGEAGCE